MTIRPKNPMYLFIVLFVPWQYFSTYIETDGNTVTFRRYFAKDGKLGKNAAAFSIEDVVKIGFPRDLKIPPQEQSLQGRYGVYSSQEMLFVLKSREVVSLNTRPYTKRQIGSLLKMFPENALQGKYLMQIMNK